MPPISLGIVSDEISQDFSEALKYALEWKISLFELRCLKTGRLPNIDKAEFKEVLELVDRHRVFVTALSPGIFKHPLSKKKELESELKEDLPRTIEMAHKLHAPLIIVFGFQRQQDDRPEYYQDAVQLMKRAASGAKDGGIRLAIENEPGFWCDSGANTASFLKDVGSPALGANWDPCNGYGTNERPYPEGYRAVKEHIFNVHAKDTLEGSLIRCVPVGKGAIDWKGQMRSLMEDRLVSHITIETHCLPLIENSKENIETLRSYMREFAEKERS